MAYFICPPNTGLFCQPNKLTRVEDPCMRSVCCAAETHAIVIDAMEDYDATAVATPTRASPVRAQDAPSTPKRTAEKERPAPRTKEVAAIDAPLVC